MTITSVQSWTRIREIWEKAQSSAQRCPTKALLKLYGDALDLTAVIIDWFYIGFMSWLDRALNEGIEYLNSFEFDETFDQNSMQS